MNAFRVLIKDSFGQRWYVIFAENMELAVASVRQAVAKVIGENEMYVKATMAEEVDGEALILNHVDESQFYLPRNPSADVTEIRSERAPRGRGK